MPEQTISLHLKKITMQDFWGEVIGYASQIDVLEFSGLVFGLLTVWFLIKQNILTWPAGIISVLISFVVFWKIQLYGDFILHIFFLVLNIYGWYYWIYGRKKNDEELEVTTLSLKTNLILMGVTIAGVAVFGYFLERLPFLIDGLQPAALPYWDATTSILSVTGMWLTTRKKMENWYYWLVVDILATGIYIYKGIYFYALLYAVYIFLVAFGLMEWKKSMQSSQH
jgi:nicotinamide mononucleotide transporter